MKVLLATQAYPPAGGGAEVQVASVARALAADGHEVAVLHRVADPARPEYEVTESGDGPVRLFALNNTHREGAGFEAYRDPSAAAAAARVMEEVAPDVVHVHHLHGLSTGLVAEARQQGLAVVVTLHDFWPVCPLGQLFTIGGEVCRGPSPTRCLGCVGGQVLAPPAGAGAARRRLAGVPGLASAAALLARISGRGASRVGMRLAAMREVLRAADLVLSPSAFLRDRLSALGHAGIEHLPNGHDPLPAVPRREAPDARVRVGFVGLAIPSKGVHVLARAWRRLDPRRVSLALHGPFVPYHGDTTYEARVRAILGPEGQAAVQGGFPHERLAEVLATIDVLVVPSLWEENAPLTVQEAFLSGAVPVVSDHGGLREAVREGVDGLRFRPGDVDDLVRCLETLASAERRGRLAAAAPRVTTTGEHVRLLEDAYARARARAARRAGRVGVAVLDRGTPEAALRAAGSADDAVLAPVRLLVENGGPAPETPPGVLSLSLPENRGFAGGMNAAVADLAARGCDRVLLLNSDARLDPGALRRLAEALEDPSLAAVGPVVLREVDGRVESRGARLDLRSGRHRLLGHGEVPGLREGLEDVPSLSGAALMVRLDAWGDVGPLDEAFFFSFEDAEWCLRAREAGYRLAVVHGARARHGGSATLGGASPDRMYYAARNHLQALAQRAPARGPARWGRTALVVGLNLAHALRGTGVPRMAALRAVAQGVADHARGRTGPR